MKTREEIEKLDDVELLKEIENVKKDFELQHPNICSSDSPEIISEAIYQISRGVRDCGKFCILKDQELLMSEFMEREIGNKSGYDNYSIECIKYKIFRMDYASICDPEDENDIRDYETIFIYRYPHQAFLMWYVENINHLDLIKDHEKFRSSEILGEYVKGKLLGYSEMAMNEHIRHLDGEMYFDMMKFVFSDHKQTLFC